MTKIAIVIQNGVLQKAFCSDPKLDLEIELINMDAVYSFKEKQENEARIRELSSEETELFQD